MSRDIAIQKLNDWRENPAQFVFDNFKVDPDPWQRKVLDVFPSMDPKHWRISMQACVGPGKSALLTWLTWNFMACYGAPGEYPKGAAVSITSDNLDDNYWAELAKWMQRSEFLLKSFTWQKTRIFNNARPENWFFSARTFSKTANAEEQGRTLSGLHSPFVMCVIDESGDIPVAVGKAAEQALATGPIFGKIVQAGNPTSTDGLLYHAFINGLWFVVKVTGDPDDPERAPRVSIDWAREQIAEYGRDNPWVKSQILGQFPPGSINSLFDVEQVDAAMRRKIPQDAYQDAQKRIGCDVARFGDDRTVFAPRQGLVMFLPKIGRNLRTNDIASRLSLAKSKWKSELELIDSTGGWGAGVVDAMIQAGHSPIAVESSGKADDPRYLNKRAEMWFRFADWCKRGGAIPDVPGLKRELTSPTYTFVKGKFQLEPKEMIKKRLGMSPDIGDAMALTFALPEMPSATSLEAILKRSKQEKNRSNSDYDPI